MLASGVKSINEVQGVRKEVLIFGEKAHLGDVVTIRRTGERGAIKAIGLHGLVMIGGFLGVFAPSELKVDKQ